MLKRLLLFILLSSLFITSSHGCFQSCLAQDSEGLSVGVKIGDYVKYIGSIPQSEFEWLAFSVVNVEGTVVKLSISYDLRYAHKPTSGGRFERCQKINVITGEGNIFLLIIPAHLKVGDVIPHSSSSFFPPLIIEGSTSRVYAGVERTVVYASHSDMPLNWEGTLFWDFETGVLTEIVAKVGNASLTSMKLVETNIWGTDSLVKFKLFFVVVIILLLVVALVLVYRKGVFRRKGGKFHGLLNTGGSIKCFIRKFDPVLYLIRSYLGDVFICFGVLIFVVGFLNLTSYSQIIFSFCFVFAVIFVVTGVLLRSGAWRGDVFKVNLGVFALCLSIIVASVAFVCAIYREIGAFVPYGTVGSFGPHVDTVSETLIIEIVYFYPFSHLAFPLFQVAVVLAICGLFFRFYYE